MSGIAGIVSLDGAPVAREEIEAMLGTMIRRGPDRRTIFCTDRLAFAHALLATTPEALGEVQPWVAPGSGCVVVSDSRIDNRAELLGLLGISLQSPDQIGDGALLLAAYQEWSEECAARLRGDFAFVIWDPRSRTIFCARDVMGVKPFHYHHVADRLFVFASDLPALRVMARVPNDVNRGRIADALVGEIEGYDKVSTFCRHVVRLPPAHTLTIRDGYSRFRHYWTPIEASPASLPTSEGEWVEAIRYQVREAVRLRLRGSIPVGSMLSGGVDSSTVVVLGERLVDDSGLAPLPVFSAINSRGACAETSGARAVLRTVNVASRTVDLQALEGIRGDLLEHRRHLSDPFGQMVMIDAVYLCAAEAGVRALLDGMPADNLYTIAGHVDNLVRQGSWRQAYRIISGSRWWNGRALAMVHGVIGVAVTAAPATLTFRAGRTRFRQDAAFEQLVENSVIDRHFAQEVNLRERYATYQEGMKTSMRRDSCGRALSCMESAYITAAVERYNRVATFRGVEPRHPFLDQRVIELHAWLPHELRFRDGYLKWALRQAMNSRLPPEVTWRQGREHLGGAFTAAVVGPELRAPSWQVSGGFLDGMVDRHRLALAKRSWSENNDGDAFTALHSAARVEAWLRGS